MALSERVAKAGTEHGKDTNLLSQGIKLPNKRDFGSGRRKCFRHRRGEAQWPAGVRLHFFFRDTRMQTIPISSRQSYQSQTLQVRSRLYWGRYQEVRPLGASHWPVPYPAEVT